MSSRCHRIGTGPTHSLSKYLGFIFFTTFIMTDNPSTFIMTPLIPMKITLITVAYITICRVRKEDRGRFLCVGKNKVGNATAPALLKVKCEWKKKIKGWQDKKLMNFQSSLRFGSSRDIQSLLSTRCIRSVYSCHQWLLWWSWCLTRVWWL